MTNAASTVTTLDQVRLVRHHGGLFTVAPGLDSDVARASLEAGLAHLPGVATATEVQGAMALGLRWLKAFPASLLSRAWVGALLAPFPRACFVVTGGVDADNAQEFVAAGAKAVGVGSALASPGQLDRLAALGGGRGPSATEAAS
jgi:2-dehydro-3-deoxyphosphogluconate aldolase / (4S)-4-hydroxy-2-oxoglutarate aldolase